jgi:Matrixin
VPAGTTCIGDGECANAHDCWEYGPSALAVTTTSFDKRSGRIWDADVEFNSPTFPFSAVETPACVPTNLCSEAFAATGDFVTCLCTDVQNTTTHEIGHMLGLAHTSRAGSTMEARANPAELSKRTVDPGTAAFVCAVYPKGQPSKSCVIREYDPAIGRAACNAAPGSTFAALALLLLRRRRA